MAIKTFKPYTPARRNMTVSAFDGVDKKAKPERSLVETLKKNAGRNSYGHITVRHRGGGNKRKYRIIDFRRDKLDMPATVQRIEYDPNRSAFIALVKYEDGELRYILAPVGLKAGDTVVSSAAADIKPGNCLPLANIRFDLYRAATREQLENGDFSLSSISDEAAMKDYRTPGNLVTILTTDIHGLASYNFTANNQPEGVYLVVQRTESEAAEVSAPFFLVVPGVGGDGGNAYTLNVRPTGTLETTPVAEVNVAEIGCTSGSFDVGQLHTWILRASVPAGIRAAQKYTITGNFDEHLTMEDSAPSVTLLTRAGAEIDLTESDHYVISHSEANGKISVSLTPAGMAYASANQGGGECTPEIRVRFQASIRENAGLDAPIPCSASVSYLNSAGVFYEAQSGAGEVHTGGIHLFVSDEAGQPLSGAAFRLVRAEDEWKEETESSTAYVNFLTGSGGKPVSEVTTGEDGRAFLWGVAYGRYYLVQTKAPDGKDKLSQPAAVTVSASSHLTAQDSSALFSATRKEKSAIHPCVFRMVNSARLSMSKSSPVKTAMNWLLASTSSSAYTLLRNVRSVKATRWPAVTATSAYAPEFFQSKICRSHQTVVLSTWF